LNRQTLLHRIKQVVKDSGSVEVRIVPEPDNPYNKGEEIAQRVDLIGAELGARRLAPTHLRKVLAVVLAVAGVKMITTA